MRKKVQNPNHFPHPVLQLEGGTRFVRERARLREPRSAEAPEDEPMLHRSTRAIALAVAVLMSQGCRWHTVPAGSVNGVGAGNEVYRAELVASGASTLYDALVRTRGLYFNTRGASSLVDPPSDAILVFRAGALMGTTESLRIMRPSDVRVVRHLSATETWQKYGRRVSVGGFEVELATN